MVPTKKLCIWQWSTKKLKHLTLNSVKFSVFLRHPRQTQILKECKNSFLNFFFTTKWLKCNLMVFICNLGYTYTYILCYNSSNFVLNGSWLIDIWFKFVDMDFCILFNYSHFYKKMGVAFILNFFENQSLINHNYMCIESLKNYTRLNYAVDWIVQLIKF